MAFNTFLSWFSGDCALGRKGKEGLLACGIRDQRQVRRNERDGETRAADGRTPRFGVARDEQMETSWNAIPSRSVPAEGRENNKTMGIYRPPVPSDGDGRHQGAIFLLTLQRTLEDELGIWVDWFGKELMINEIGEGLVSKWNLANPEKKVRVGDCILEINGSRGTPQQLDIALAQAAQASSITMLISCHEPQKASPSIKRDMHGGGGQANVASQLEFDSHGPANAQWALYRMPSPDMTTESFPRLASDLSLSPTSQAELTLIERQPHQRWRAPAKPVLELHRLPSPDLTVSEFSALRPVVSLDSSPILKDTHEHPEIRADTCHVLVDAEPRNRRGRLARLPSLESMS